MTILTCDLAYAPTHVFVFQFNPPHRPPAPAKAPLAFDLLGLVENDSVRVRATGQSLTAVHLEVENLQNRSWRVCLPAGTKFPAKGGHQDMVSIRDQAFTLGPLGRLEVVISAACLNATRPVPEAKDGFDSPRPVTGPVAQFVKAAREAEDGLMVQAGVWALTDGYTADQITAALVARDRHGRAHTAIAPEQIQAAKRLLNQLGLANPL